jgi:hypothetical protein
MRIRLSNGSAPSPPEILVTVVAKLLAMHIRGGPVRVSPVGEKTKMASYQDSTFLSRQSCSQSADGDERAIAALLSAAHEQLWLSYKPMKTGYDWLQGF